MRSDLKAKQVQGRSLQRNSIYLVQRGSRYGIYYGVVISGEKRRRAY